MPGTTLVNGHIGRIKLISLSRVFFFSYICCGYFIPFYDVERVLFIIPLCLLIVPFTLDFSLLLFWKLNTTRNGCVCYRYVACVLRRTLLPLGSDILDLASGFV